MKQAGLVKDQISGKWERQWKNKNGLDLVETKFLSPRAIHIHLNFESVVDTEEKAALLKSLRVIDEHDIEMHDRATAISQDVSISLNNSLDSKDSKSMYQ